MTHQKLIKAARTGNDGYMYTESVLCNMGRSYSEDYLNPPNLYLFFKADYDNINGLPALIKVPKWILYLHCISDMTNAR